MPVGAGGSPVLGRGRAHPLPAGERRAPRLRPPVPRNGPGEEAREKLQSSSPRRGPFPSPAPLPRRAGKRPPAPAGPPRWAGLGCAGRAALPPSLPPSRRTGEPRLLPAPPGYRPATLAACQTLPDEDLLAFFMTIFSSAKNRAV